MKSSILTSSIAAMLLAVPIIHADDRKYAADAAASSSASASGDSPDGRHPPHMAPMKRGKGPWVGIAMEPVPDVVRDQLSLARGEGITVSHVVPDSPAAKAGLKEHDILLRFEDQILVDPGAPRALIGMKKPGDAVKLAYLRKGERKEAAVTLVEHELEPGEGRPMPWGPFPPNLPGLRDGGIENRPERLQELFKHLKDMHPEIVDKRSWLSGPGGWNRDQFRGMLENMRRQVEDSNLLKEEKERILKNVEESFETARKAFEDAMKETGRAHKDGDKRRGEAPDKDNRKRDDLPKKPSEPL